MLATKSYSWPLYEKSAPLVTNHYLIDEALFLTEVHTTYKSVVSIGTRLRAGRSRVRILVGTKGLFLHQNVQTDCGSRPASSSMGTQVGRGVSLGGKAAGTWGWRWMLGLRMSGVTPLLPLYAVIADIGATLLFTIHPGLWALLMPWVTFILETSPGVFPVHDSKCCKSAVVCVLHQFLRCWTRLKEVVLNYSYRRVDLHTVC
jgi:hypothetical protein